MFYDERVGGPDPAPSPSEWSPLPPAEIDGLSDDAVLARLEALDRARAGLDAERVRLLARFAALRPPQPGSRLHDRCEFAADEVAAATAVSTATATNQVSEACALSARLPATLAALAAGTIDYLRARAVVDATARLDDAKAAAVDARIVQRGRRGSPSLFRRALRRLVTRIDPHGAEDRRRMAAADRDVRIDTRPEDGMAALYALLPAETALAVHGTLARLAKAMPEQDGRTLAQRRADILADLVLGRAEHAAATVAVDVNVTVAAGTLAGADDKPARLHGYGTITAAHARRLAHNATWRRLLTDGPDGTVVEVGRRRFPSPHQVRHVRARNRHCVFPGCVRASEGCDTDHTRPHHQRGPTVTANLGPLCRHHHRLKDEGRWTLAQPTPGRFVWTTPTGRAYTTDPDADDD